MMGPILALLVLDLEIGSASVLRGEILTANETTRRLQLRVIGGAECVDVPDKVGIFLIREGSSEEGDFDDLTPGLRTSVYGAFEGGIVACGGSEGLLCPSGTFCVVARMGSAASCRKASAKKEPAECSGAVKRVCGCDGQDYDNGCIARQNGTGVGSLGPC